MEPNTRLYSKISQTTPQNEKGEHFYILCLTTLRAYMLHAAAQQHPPPA